MLLIIIIQQLCPQIKTRNGILKVDIALDVSYIGDAYFAKAHTIKGACQKGRLNQLNTGKVSVCR